jgi:hypothetical protein
VFHHVNLEQLNRGIYCGIGIRLRKDRDNSFSFLISFSAPQDAIFGSEANTEVFPFGALIDGWYYVTLDYLYEGDTIRNAALKISQMNLLTPGSTPTANHAAQRSITMRLRPFRPVRPNRRDHSGHLVLGGWNSAISQTKPNWMGSSFAGEVAWIHGFREPLDTSELVQKDVSERWLTRWNH